MVLLAPGLTLAHGESTLDVFHSLLMSPVYPDDCALKGLFTLQVGTQYGRLNRGPPEVPHTNLRNVCECYLT